MVKAKRAFCLLIVSLLCLLLLCSCGSGKNALVGKWEKSGGSSSSAFWYLYFYSDGTYTSGGSNYKGTYSVDGKNLRLEGFLVDDVNATFEIKGNTLYLDYWARSETFEKVKD